MATEERYFELYFKHPTYEIYVLQKLHHLDAMKHFRVISLLAWPMTITTLVVLFS